MSTIVNTNMESIGALNTLNRNNRAQNNVMARITSGLKINSAADNASGYAISERMRERIRSLHQVNQNIQNDQAMVKTAESGLANTIEILRTMKERALNAANDSNKDTDRAIIQKEIDSLIEQIDSNANVKYNGKALINGTTFKTGNEAGLQGVFINTSLTETGTTGYDSPLSEVGGIVSTDQYTLSWIRNGTFGSASGEIGIQTLTGIFASEAGEIGLSADNLKFVKAGSEVGSVKGVDGLAFKSPFTGFAFVTNETGFDNDISYLHIQISGKDGTTKDAATAALNGWVNVQSAQDQGTGSPLNFRIGEETSLGVSFGNMTAKALGVTGIKVTGKEEASAAAGAFDTALNRALEEQTKIGSLQSRLGYTSDNITSTIENVQASQSAIRDADMAEEMSNFMKWSILSQTSQLMLAQAGQNAYSVLNLLQP